MVKKIILTKSKAKGKRYNVAMSGFKNMSDHSHDFGSKGGKTYVDNRSDKEKKAWEARHKNDTGYNNKHSGIFYSKNILWGASKDIKKNIKSLEKKLDSTIINNI